MKAHTSDSVNRSWHGYKYIDPAESGAVLPIVHVNGFKISERTIYGTMDDAELVALFSGYGYHVRFVEDLSSIHSDLAASVAWAIGVIRDIQNKARNGTPEVKPRWPVLILRTPKGWSGPKVFKGDYIEGSFKSHQVPLSSPNEDGEQLEILKSWLESYDIHELINPESGVPIEELLSIIPDKVNKKLGMRREAYDAHEPLVLPDWKDYVAERGTQQSAMKTTGEFLHGVIEKSVLFSLTISPA
jgi:xylulose-5-phosphate/fructose-6-phosphate phosphoketolase